MMADISSGNKEGRGLDGDTKIQSEETKANTSTHATVGTNNNEGQVSEDDKLLDMLGLRGYYRDKLTIKDVMQVRNFKDDKGIEPCELPFEMLKKLMMIDFRGRDETTSMLKRNEKTTADNRGATTFEDLLDDFNIESDGYESLNPLDVFLVTFNCCSLNLRQVLLEKLFMCKLAVPLIFPRLENKGLEFSLWALRSITFTWRDEKNEVSEISAAIHPAKIVSCLRVGRSSLSKSKLLNDVLSDKAHNIFFHRDCPNGSMERKRSGGLTEVAWYLPSGHKNDVFPEVTMILNLRGDAVDYDKQVQILTMLSSVLCIIVDVEDFSENETQLVLKNIYDRISNVIVLFSSEATRPNLELFKKIIPEYKRIARVSNNEDIKVITPCSKGKLKNATELKEEMRQKLKEALNGRTGKSLEDCAKHARELNIHVDEDDPNCQRGIKLANNVICDRTAEECKGMLTLQGEIWLEWSNTLKKLHKTAEKAEQKTTAQHYGNLEQEMNRLREQQGKLANNLRPLTRIFMNTLVDTVNNADVVTCFLEWLKFRFDKSSRKHLPAIIKSYYKYWQELKEVKKQQDKNKIKKLESKITAAEKKLASVSLGLEHMFREIGQLYECAHSGKTQVERPIRDKLKSLPKSVAQLLLSGYPMEVMDGDAANIPITWVRAVLSSIKELIGNKKVFILSVLGVQSSGKSTLLNTMFGLKFAVSAGRCTRGVYMQLVPVERESNLPFDYFLVIDTEGLRAPELGLSTYSHDNELATLAIGMAGMSIINIKGENTAEIQDILQIAVHAFLRMKIVRKGLEFNQACIFVHQNVPDVNAKDKMMYGCQKLQDTLDLVTKEAAEQEHVAHITSFSQVIKFEGQKHVWYFSDLWHGDPLMAPANPGYSEKVQNLKDFLMEHSAKHPDSCLSLSNVSLRIDDLWKGIMADDFVFSFRNSLEVRAYKSMESSYFKLSWDLEKHVLDFLSGEVEICFSSQKSYAELQACCAQLEIDLDKAVTKKLEDLQLQFKEFFDKGELKEITIQWRENRLNALKSSTGNLIDKAKREIRRMKENRELDLRRGKKDDVYRDKVIPRAKELAEEMKDKKTSDIELREQFETMWQRWKRELAPKEPKSDVPIQVTVENVLRERLRSVAPILNSELANNALSGPFRYPKLEDSFGKQRIYINELSYRKTFLQKFHMSEEHKKKCQQEVFSVISDILVQVDVIMKDLITPGKRFDSSYITQVLKEVEEGFKRHQANDDRLSDIMDTLRVKVVLHVFKFATSKFEEMQQNYEKYHGYKAKLESYKDTIWTIFKATVEQTAEEVTTAGLLCSRLKADIPDAVAKSIPTNIVDEILREFSFSNIDLS